MGKLANVEYKSLNLRSRVIRCFASKCFIFLYLVFEKYLWSLQSEKVVCPEFLKMIFFFNLLKIIFIPCYYSQKNVSIGLADSSQRE